MFSGHKARGAFRLQQRSIGCEFIEKIHQDSKLNIAQGETEKESK